MSGSASPSARLRPWFEDYASAHRATGNQATHLVGIPVLLVSILGLLAGLGSFGNGWLHAGTLLWAVAAGFYLFLDWRLGLPFALIGFGLMQLGVWLPALVLWILFVLGWILQFVGHLVYEKESPAFFRNLLHLLIGPLWVYAKLIGRDGGSASRNA